MLFTKNVFVFIDVENIRGAAHDAGYSDFDFEKLADWLIKKHGAKRIYFFPAIDDYDSTRKEVFSRLAQIPGCYVVSKEVTTYRTNNLKKVIDCPKCTHQFIKEFPIANRRKGNCDTELTLEIIKQGIRKRFTHAVVFSSDGDFAKVYEYVVETLKKQVIIFAPLGEFRKRTALKLKEMDNQKIISILPLNDLYDKYCIK